MCNTVTAENDAIPTIKMHAHNAKFGPQFDSIMAHTKPARQGERKSPKTVQGGPCGRNCPVGYLPSRNKINISIKSLDGLTMSIMNALSHSFSFSVFDIK
jgi:hypothetical protein